MGWASGSGLADDLWDLVREYIPEGKREHVANEVIELFEMADCDTMQEAELLWSDACRPEECWECGNEFDPIELDGDGLCQECSEENNNE